MRGWSVYQFTIAFDRMEDKLFVLAVIMILLNILNILIVVAAVAVIDAVIVADVNLVIAFFLYI